MGAVENLKDLTKCINDFGVKYRVVVEAMATLGKSFASYIENDVKSICWLSVYSLPNNEKKIMGLPNVSSFSFISRSSSRYIFSRLLSGGLE